MTLCLVSARFINSDCEKRKKNLLMLMLLISTFSPLVQGLVVISGFRKITTHVKAILHF